MVQLIAFEGITAMARRSDHSREELLALALAAAETLVANEGLAALSARRVAKEIGYAPGTLYNLFEDLDDLVLRVNARTLDGLRRTLEALPEQDSPRLALHALARRYLAYTRKNSRLWQALLSFRRSKPAPPPAWYQAHLRGLVATVSSAVGAFPRPLDSRERNYRARLIWASLHGVCSLAEAGSIGRSLVTPLDRMVHDLIEMHCDALEDEGS